MKEHGNTDLFSVQAHHYARYRPEYPRELYEYIFGYLRRKQYAWDCATGSGQVAGTLAGHFEKVYANDISREQLNHAVRKENIEYFNKPAENTGFPAGMFDLVTVAQAIHWLDFNRFYDEVGRTAADGALIAVIGYGRVQADPVVDTLIAQLYEHAFDSYFNENRQYINDAYKTIPFPFEEIPTPRFHTTYWWNLEMLKGYFNSWSSIPKFKNEKGYNPADETVKKIRQTVAPNSLLRVTFPIFLRLGVCRT